MFIYVNKLNHVKNDLIDSFCCHETSKNTDLVVLHLRMKMTINFIINSQIISL